MPVNRRLSLLPPLDVDVGIVGDQPRRPADLRHDGVAGIDAEPALDAAEIGAVADVDAGRTDRDALVAVDAIAGRLSCGAQRAAFFTEMRGSPRS